MLQGKLYADFSDFSRAVKEAEVQLKGFEQDAGKVSAQLNRMTGSFSGVKIIQEATLAAKAVEHIGGASKLTEAEQAKVNRTVTEAIEKYKALGSAAPAELLKLQDATKKIGPPLVQTQTDIGKIYAGLKSVAGVAGVAFSARAVMGFVGGVFDAASKVKDLSTQLGISTSAVQGFKFAAEQSGSSLDAVGTAIQKMNQKLGEGDKSTIKALADVGLKFEDIRAMKPEDAFLAITDQIQKIEDPMLRAKVALELFGKGAAELLPAIDAGIRKTAAGTTKMSEQTIKDLDAAQDAWEALANKVTIISGGIIADTMRAASQATRSWEDFFAVAGKIGARMAGLPGVGALADAGLDINELTAKQRAFDAAFDAKFRAQQAGGGAGGGGKPPDAGSLGTAAVNEHAKAVKALMDAFSGAKVIATANLHLEAITGNMRQGIPLAQMTREQQDAINKAMAEAQEVYRALGQEVPPAIRAVYIATLDMSKGVPIVAGLSAEFAKLGAIIKVLPTWVPSVSGLTADFGRIGDIAHVQQEGEKIGVTFGQAISDSFSGTMQHVPDILSDALKRGDLRSGLIESATLLGGEAGAAMGAAIGGPLGAAIGRELGELAGPALDKFFGMIGFGNAGRDLVKDFAASFGGFDQLHAELAKLNTDGEQAGEKLWIALSQGVGRNNPEQARAAIESVMEALAGHLSPLEQVTAAGFQTQAELQGIADKAKTVYDTMRESGLFTAATLEDAWKQYQAALEKAVGVDPGAQKALDAVKALDDELKGLFKSIENEAPEEVMGVIEANTRAQIAGIQKERDAAQLALEQTAGDAAKTAEDAAQLIEKTLGAHDFRVKVKIDLDDPSGILSGRTAGGILRGGAGGWTNESSSQQPIVLHHQTTLDTAVIAEELVTFQKRMGLK